MTKRPLKILFLGALAVGKTSLIRRLVTGGFGSDYKSTLGVQIHQLRTQTEDRIYDLMLWDTDGDVDEAIFRSPYIRGADGAVIACDIKRPATGDTLLRLAYAMETSLPGRPSVGVVNKIDLGSPDATFLNDISAVCDFTALTSALSGAGVENALHGLVHLISARSSS